VSTASRTEAGTIAATPLPAAAVSGPRTIHFHAVDDAELEQLMKFEKPVLVASAAVFIGLFIGTAFQALGALSAIMSGAARVAALDVLFLVICCVSLGAGAALAVIASRGRSGVEKALNEIRDRAMISLPQGHPAAPDYDD